MSDQQQQKFPPFKPYLMKPEEEGILSDEEKTILMRQPNEQDSIWEEVTSKTGNKYSTASESAVLTASSKFYGMLTVNMEEGYSHVVLGGLTFTKGSQNKIIRNIYKEYKKFGGTTPAKFKPKYLEEVFLGTVHEINEKIKTGDWQLSYPAVVIGDKILIVRNKV